MADIRVVYPEPYCAPAGRHFEGVFWRNGERWVREGGKEFRMMDLAPDMEADYMARLQKLPRWRPEQRRARLESLRAAHRHTKGTERKPE